MASEFATLLAGLDAGRLREAMAAPALLDAPGAAAGLKLIDRDAIGRALAQGLIAPEHCRIWAGRRQMDLTVTGAEREGKLVRETLGALAQQGTTMVVNRLDTVFPHLWDFAEDAEAALGDPVSITAISSSGDRSGIDTHYDRNGTIIVQLDGAKHWHFHGEPQPGSLRPGKPGEPGAVTHTILLQPGDALFVPSGLYHHCTAEGTSLHLALLLSHRSGGMLLRQLARIANQDAAFNTAVPGLLEPQMLAERLSGLQARLIELARGIDLAALPPERMAGERGPRPSGPDPDGPSIALLPG